MLSVVIEKCVESTGGGYLKMDRFKSFECDLSSEDGGSNEVALVCGGEQIGALEDSHRHESALPAARMTAET